jgi:hypothetical protein
VNVTLNSPISSLLSRLLSRGKVAAWAVIFILARGASAQVVTLPPTIDAEPTNQTVFINNAASFTVGASGLLILYQWYFNSNSLSLNGISPTLTIPNAALTNAGTYTVVVYNIVGSVTSAPVTLTVLKSNASVTLNNLSQSYTGTARTVTAITAPTNLSVNLTYNGSTAAPTNPGSYTVIGTINDAVYTGAATNTLTVTGSLTVAGVTVSNKVYDGTTSATVNASGATLAGVVGTDVVTLGGTAVGTFATPTVGNGKTVTITGFTIGGANAGNYTLAQPTATANITMASSSNALSSSLNPAGPGSNVVLTATLRAIAPGGGTPTGSVNFKDGSSTLGSSALSGSGLATFSTSGLSHALHTLSAEYAGDGNFKGSTNTLSQLIDSSPIAATATFARGAATSLRFRASALLTNTSDPENDAITLVSVSAQSAAGGSVGISGPWIVYTPPAGFTNVDSFSYVIADSFSLAATGIVSAAIRIDTGAASNIGSIVTSPTMATVHFNAIPARAYTIQYTLSLPSSSWQALGSATAGSFGNLDYIDTTTQSRFYRSTFP